MEVQAVLSLSSELGSCIKRCSQGRVLVQDSPGGGGWSASKPPPPPPPPPLQGRTEHEHHKAVENLSKWHHWLSLAGIERVQRAYYFSFNSLIMTYNDWTLIDRNFPHGFTLFFFTWKKTHYIKYRLYRHSTHSDRQVENDKTYFPLECCHVCIYFITEFSNKT